MEYKGVILDQSSPKNVIYASYENKLISDKEGWINMLVDRNKTSHVYDVGTFEEVLAALKTLYIPQLEALYLHLKRENPDAL